MITPFWLSAGDVGSFFHRRTLFHLTTFDNLGDGEIVIVKQSREILTLSKSDSDDYKWFPTQISTFGTKGVDEIVVSLVMTSDDP